MDKENKSTDDLARRLERLEKRLDTSEADATHWKKRWQRVDEELRKANGRISLLEHENEELKSTLEKKDAQIKQLQKDKFGRKTEVSDDPVTPACEEAPPKRPRGKQPGAKGFGRKIRTNLPVEEHLIDVPQSSKLCSSCGKHRELLPFTEDSEEIDYEYKLVRIRYKRQKYKKTCRCAKGSTIVTAPAPPKLIPKGMLSIPFWAHVLIEKFWLQRPLSRICMSLNLQGLEVSESLFASGLKSLTKCFAPLYNALRSRSRGADRWQMDETHWRVFTDLMGKSNHNWWLWVVETEETTVFLLDPSRSSSVPLRHLKDLKTGIVTCDRYSAYKPLREQGLELSYCWAHVRRDFVKIRDGFPTLKKFADDWLERINLLFFHHKRSQFSTAKKICTSMKTDAKRLLRDSKLHEAKRAALESLMNHWYGLTLFLELTELPLDNNACERALRNPVVGRKNYYGSRSIWSGALASMLFSIFSTLAKNRVDPYQYMLRYLTACAENGGRAPLDISTFLPWNLAPEWQTQHG